jgi:hypothetical protein
MLFFSHLHAFTSATACRFDKTLVFALELGLFSLIQLVDIERYVSVRVGSARSLDITSGFLKKFDSGDFVIRESNSR